MAVCPRCGKAHGSDDRFCGFCGYNLTVESRSDFVTQRDLKVKDIRFNLGVLYFNGNKYEEAVDIFGKILHDTPDHLQAIDMYERAKSALAEASAEPEQQEEK